MDLDKKIGIKEKLIAEVGVQEAETIWNLSVIRRWEQAGTGVIFM